jgi:hypothetical protein
MKLGNVKQLTTIPTDPMYNPICEKSDYIKKLEKTIKSLREIIEQLEVELERKIRKND